MQAETLLYERDFIISLAVFLVGTVLVGFVTISYNAFAKSKYDKKLRKLLISALITARENLNEFVHSGANKTVSRASFDKRRFYNWVNNDETGDRVFDKTKIKVEEILSRLEAGQMQDRNSADSKRYAEETMQLINDAVAKLK